MSDTLVTFVAGGALVNDAMFNVKCNCGGDAPITPKSTAGHGFSKKSSETKVVDKIETGCTVFGTTIMAETFEGDPDYLLVEHPGVDSLFLPTRLDFHAGFRNYTAGEGSDHRGDEKLLQVT